MIRITIPKALERISTFALIAIALIVIALVLQPNTLYAQTTEPPTPTNLTSKISSSRTAEIFWDRAIDPLTQYDIFRNDVLISAAQFGISFYDFTLVASQTYTYQVLAIDRFGNRSRPISIDVTTPATGIPEQGTLPAPQLTAVLYSPRTGEIFWDRAADPFTVYDVFLNDVMVRSGQSGISHWEPFLNPSISNTFRVVARDANGNFSPSSAGVTLGGASIQQPQSLTVSVYSSSAAELFWDRQGLGQRFVVQRDGITLATTDGTSLFDDTLTGAGDYNYEVFAINDVGERSTPATITATVSNATGGGNGPDPVSDADISLANAEDIVRGVMNIALGRLFIPMRNAAEASGQLLVDSALLSRAQSETPMNGVTVIPGSDTGFSETNTPGLNGGLYTCDAGGDAALPAFLAFEAGGHVAEFTDCVLPDGLAIGTAQLIVPVPRSGNLGSEQLLNWQFVFNNGDDYQVREFDTGGRTMFADRVRSQFDTTAQGFGATINGEAFIIDALSTSLLRRIGPGQDVENTGEDGAPAVVEFADSTLDSSFDIQAPFTAFEQMDVVIDLAFDFRDVDNPSLRWQTGSINVTAPDGSNLQASVQPDGNTVRIQVGDEFIDAPYEIIE